MLIDLLVFSAIRLRFLHSDKSPEPAQRARTSTITGRYSRRPSGLEFALGWKAITLPATRRSRFIPARSSSASSAGYAGRLGVQEVVHDRAVELRLQPDLHGSGQRARDRPANPLLGLGPPAL